MRLVRATQQEIEQEPSVAAMLTDVKATMEHPGFTDDYAIVAYIYGTNNRRLYCIIGNGSDLYPCVLLDDEAQPVGGAFLRELYDEYQVYFSALNNEAQIELHVHLSEGIRNCWKKLFQSFIEPVLGIGKGREYKEVLCKFEAQVGSTKVFFPLPMCHHLAFRYYGIKENLPLYFTSVTDESFYDWFTGMLPLTYPRMADVVMVTGQVGSGDTEEKGPAAQRMREIRRLLLEKINHFIIKGGGECRRLESAGDFRHLFSKDNKRNIIQLLAHHSDGKLEADDGSIVKVSDIVHEMQLLRAKGQLHENIVLDAINCRNDGAFRDLKAAGLRQINYSYDLLNTYLSVAQLYEMYSGELAIALGWKFPYFNSGRHLHTIYADIIRAQYVNMNINGEQRINPYK